MIYIILGTKGQFMKMFPLMKLFDKHKVSYKFIHTGQHYGIIEDNIKRFKIRKPDVYLTIKKKDLKNIWEMLLWMPKVLWNARKLSITKNDWIIIHGDTESTLLAFIMAKYFKAKTAHVEAGYRSKSILEPFPEELIRIILDKFCDVAFCPYEEFRYNLKGKKRIVITNGNTVFDSARLALEEKISQKAKNIMNKQYVVLLVHRKENVFSKKRMDLILDTLEIILRKKIRVIWPLHANTKFELQKQGIWKKIKSFQSRYDLVLDYFFDYVDFMHLVKSSEFVASDGGGLQKETYYMNKPMLILRKKTENEPGVGENSYLSCLEKKKILHFLKNYKKFKRKNMTNGSPSQIICDYYRKNI